MDQVPRCGGADSVVVKSGGFGIMIQGGSQRQLTHCGEVVSCNADVVDETASVLVDHVVNLQRNFQEFYRESVGVYELKVPLLRAHSKCVKGKRTFRSGPSVRPSFLPSFPVRRPCS